MRDRTSQIFLQPWVAFAQAEVHPMRGANLSRRLNPADLILDRIQIGLKAGIVALIQRRRGTNDTGPAAFHRE
jgi:hypothetical protein